MEQQISVLAPADVHQAATTLKAACENWSHSPDYASAVPQTMTSIFTSDRALCDFAHDPVGYTVLSVSMVLGVMFALFFAVIIIWRICVPSRKVISKPASASRPWQK